MDVEQLRQFQQFQQFQDYLKFTEAQKQSGAVVPQPSQPPQPPVPHQTWQPAPAGPPPGELVPSRPARPKAPRWLKWVVRKLLGWLVLLVILGLAAAWLLHHYFPSDEGKTSAEIAAEGGGTYKTNQILSTHAYEAVRDVYDAVAQNLVPQACGRMREDIQQKFAADLGYGDCQQAVLGLHAKVTAVNDYAESIPSYTSQPIPGGTFTISSCQFGIHGGPALGAFTVTKVEKDQWLITGHTNESDPCPAPTPSSSPTG